MPSEFGTPGAVAPTCASERILAAASDLCTLVGVKHATISDIARHADVSEDAIYGQWGAVTDILSAVVIRDFRAGIDDTESRVHAHEQLEDMIAEAFASTFWFLDSHPIVGGAVRSDADTILPEAQVSIAAVITAVTRWLVDIIGMTAHRSAGLVIDAELLEEITTRLIQSMLLAPNLSGPSNTFVAIADYARRRFVPLVYAMCRPGSGGCGR
ncbi:TetR/AcrR family transcriptional regulator [Mycolicibacterium stellerae]|uniref:TetR/AcrR family transcriptional regulator n=1 Tax=Mycolicibacterium stellerae TaxID=2358193 RepID=UPI001F4422A6|nr:TetR/AcrR family transcriptional regulator [Mycolicibacterium stellerae]